MLWTCLLNFDDFLIIIGKHSGSTKLLCISLLIEIKISSKLLSMSYLVYIIISQVVIVIGAVYPSCWVVQIVLLKYLFFIFLYTEEAIIVFFVTTLQH